MNTQTERRTYSPRGQTAASRYRGFDLVVRNSCFDIYRDGRWLDTVEGMGSVRAFVRGYRKTERQEARK